MSNVELTQTDIAERVAALLPPELWDRYCYLSYARMAKVPELAEYANDLREAERSWFRACKTGHAAVLLHKVNRSAGSERSHTT